MLEEGVGTVYFGWKDDGRDSVCLREGASTILQY